MGLHNLRQGYVVQELLFKDIELFFKDETGIIARCVNRYFAEIDKQVEEQYDNVQILFFAEDIFDIFLLGTYGKDFIISDFLPNDNLIQVSILSSEYCEEPFTLLFPYLEMTKEEIPSIVFTEYKNLIDDFIESGFCSLVEVLD